MEEVSAMKDYDNQGMKNILYNMGYFLREAVTIVKTNLLSNLLSLFSTILIFFIFVLTIAGYQVSGYVVKAIEGDAQISVYYNESLDDSRVMELMEKIKAIDGVNEVKIVNKEEAYSRMEKILGKDAHVLTLFDDNPFSSFFEANISLDKMEPVLKSISLLEGIDYVRDNREVLEKIKNIKNIFSLLGYLILSSTIISTLIIISHIISMGIQSNNEEIYTLKLLGAPDAFIGFPFLLEGLLLTLLGGAISSVLGAFAVRHLYVMVSGPLPFIPLPPLGELIPGLIVLVTCFSLILGIAGSLFGLISVRKS